MKPSLVDTRETFPVVNRQMGEDRRWRPAQGIVCSRCGADEWKSAAHGVRVDEHTMATAFRSKGWRVEDRRDRHLCPACAAKQQDEARARRAEKEAAMAEQKSERSPAAALAELVAHYAAVRKRIIAGPPKPANVSRPALACQPKPAAPRPLVILSMRGAATARFAPAAWPAAIAGAPWLRVRLSPQAIIAMVARKAGITISEIKSARRHADLVLARRVAVVLLCRFTRLSLPQMGRALGGRDHTTIMHARDMARAAIGERDLPDDIAACADALFAALREGRAA